MNIVFADDQAEIRSLLTDWFTHKGHRVRCVGEIRDLLACLHDSPPDVICLDYLMPESPGLSIIETIQRLAPETSIVLMTGLVDKDIERYALERGVDAFVMKPFSLPKLEKVLSAKAY